MTMFSVEQIFRNPVETLTRLEQLLSQLAEA